MGLRLVDLRGSPSLRQTEQPRRVLFRHASDLLLGEPARVHGREKLAEPIWRQRIPLLTQVGRQDAELGSDLPNRVGKLLKPGFGVCAGYVAADEFDEG